MAHVASGLNAKDKIAHSPATFVIPFYGDQVESARYLAETLESIYAQTDQNWHVVIIDDVSPQLSSQQYLQKLEGSSPRITVIRQSENRGQGACRNLGVELAFKKESPIILFNDADDLSAPNRLQVVREIFLEEPEVDLVYSSFRIIDEHGQLVPRERTGPSILEIIDAIETDPVEGYDAWIKIGTVTGFVCATSSTAVRTAIAYECPSPCERISEDSYLWMSIAAKGNAFKFMPLIPSLYRIPTDKEGSTHRTRIGRKTFYYAEKARVDTEGFLNAINIALARQTITAGDVDGLKARFFRRLADTLIKEDESELAEEILRQYL